MRRWSSWIALAALAAASLALVAALMREDTTGGFDQRCTARGGTVIAKRDSPIIVQDPHRPVAIGYPTTQQCIGPNGEVLGAR